MKKTIAGRIIDEGTETTQPAALGLPDELHGYSAQEIADQRRLAREVRRHVEALAQSGKAAKRASACPLPFK